MLQDYLPVVKEEESYAAVERNASGSRPKELFLVRLLLQPCKLQVAAGWCPKECNTSGSPPSAQQCRRLANELILMHIIFLHSPFRTCLKRWRLNTPSSARRSRRR